MSIEQLTFTINTFLAPFFLAFVINEAMMLNDLRKK